MATWITHLRIAENFMERVPGLAAGPFAVGNIAPDSGIPDEKWENFNPPPKVTHFHAQPGSAYQIADLDFYRQYLAPLSGTAPDSVFSFRLGYFFHLITDNLWREYIGKPARKRWHEQFAADPQFIWEVKEDWYGQDFIYIRSHPASLFWTVFLDSIPDPAGLDFIPPNALSQQVDYIKIYYQRRDEEIAIKVARPMIYLSADEMDRFVERATEDIYAVYHRLWVDLLPVGDVTTVLNWQSLVYNE